MNEKNDNRNLFITIFVCILFFSLISTFLVYYFVRYKKKFYFDASGRRFIVSSGEYSHFVYKLIEILQFDNQSELEQQVIGILKYLNDANQGILHLCAIYGAKSCLFYVLDFGILNANACDNYGNTPIYYLIKRHHEETRKNMEMFLRLGNCSDMSMKCSDGEDLMSLLNQWQKQIYQKYIQNSFIQQNTLTTQ